ncbi:hypothetical protein PT279_00240 [Bifidobacterium sp. ESL0784]|uniref:hypothetical protein n=1 Tax=Bifidobacterium sp. ESL0784 TaxID=2983231 RepID=UPI0023F9E0FC|nr:hypothetical protein [Bifidobacterium sp. ESL0784]MDF7640036.1 hypothetical protein [Bifidobacterium sp. ESL0784]
MTSAPVNNEDNGFHKVFGNSPKLSKTSNQIPLGNQTALSVSEKVIDGLTRGQTPRMIATNLSLPLDFIDLVIEQERTAGRLNIYDLRSCNSTTGEGCNPDPESLVCAGCPILPKAIRQRQSVFGRLKAKLRIKTFQDK